MKIILPIVVILICNIKLYSQPIYKFDTTANIYGCSNISLQKISKNRQHELMIVINEIDSLPKSKEFDLAKYSRFLLVYLNKYPKENKHVQSICSDVFVLQKRTYIPHKYMARNGTILIKNWDEKDHTISLLLYDVTLQDEFGNKIILACENFKDLTVGWIGG